MKKLHVIFIASLVFSLILSSFSGCSKSNKTEKVRGVTDTEIIIGQWGPQTGPAALWGTVARGSAAYFKLINDEGGINGRKIRYIYRDDAYQPEKTKAIVKELVEKEDVFAFVGGVSTRGGLAVKDYLEQNKVPWVGPSTGSLHFCYPPAKYLFTVYPTYSDEASILVDYTINTLSKKRIAIIYQNDDYGKGGLIGAQLAMKSNGIEFVEVAVVNPVETDLSSHILKLKEAGADAVIMYLLPKQAAISLGTAMKLDFKPQWVASSTLSDIPLMFAISKGLWKNVIFSSISEPADEKC
ncbi:ABC transporter substrate-binding protein, partial [bacterium]|nr:ABC transporter substrate-binding protein [bacterium]